VAFLVFLINTDFCFRPCDSDRFYSDCSCFDCFYSGRSYSGCSADFCYYCYPLKITRLSQILSVNASDLFFLDTK